MKLSLACLFFVSLFAVESSSNGADTNSVKSFTFESAIQNIKKPFDGKFIQQDQYIVDLDNGCLWHYTLKLKLDSGEFVAVWGQEPKEAIISLQRGQLSPLVHPSRGVAHLNDKFYSVNVLTGNWEPENPSIALAETEQFNYLTLDSSKDFQGAINGDAEKPPQIDSGPSDGPSKSLDEQVANVREKGATASFQRGKWFIEIKVLPNGLIESWKVSGDDLTHRLIVNNIVADEPLGLTPLFTISENQEKPVPLTEIYAKLGDVPVLGLYIVKSESGQYIAGAVLKDSSAEEAGIHANDIIRAINAKPVKELTSDQIRAILKESD